MSQEKKLIEAALFISPKPLSLEELIRISSIGSLGLLKKEIEDLQQEYAERGMEVVEIKIEGDGQTQPSVGYQMQVRQEFLPKVANLTPYSDLSEGSKRTLAVVIYKEPLKQSELVKMQGNKIYVYVKELEKRGLIKSERLGHTKILRVTNEFEKYFGESKDAIRESIRASLEGSQLVEQHKPKVKIEEAPKNTKKKAKKPKPKTAGDGRSPYQSTDEVTDSVEQETPLLEPLKELSVSDLK